MFGSTESAKTSQRHSADISLGGSVPRADGRGTRVAARGGMLALARRNTGARPEFPSFHSRTLSRRFGCLRGDQRPANGYRLKPSATASGNSTGRPAS